MNRLMQILKIAYFLLLLGVLLNIDHNLADTGNVIRHGHML